MKKLNQATAQNTEQCQRRVMKERRGMDGVPAIEGEVGCRMVSASGRPALSLYGDLILIDKFHLPQLFSQ